VKAVILKSPGHLVIEDIPVPRPRADEVLIEVEACGICGSDIRYFHGENPWAKQTLGISKSNSPNMVLGHEFGGKIVEAGSKSLQKRVGQRVAVLAYKACGECYQCKLGRHNLCGYVKHIGHSAGWDDEIRSGEYNPGGMAQFCRVWSDMAYQIPDSIDSASATLLDGLAVAIHATGKAGLKKDTKPLDGEFEHVLIMGSGTIGLLIQQVAKAFGAKNIISADNNARPLEVAIQLGADYVINVKEKNIESQVIRLTNAYGVNAIFETVGTGQTIVQSLELICRNSSISF